MKRYNLYKHIRLLGVVVCFGILFVLARIPPHIFATQDHPQVKPKLAPPGKILPRLQPVANLKEAEVLLARFEKELPGAQSSRVEMLAASARLCYILGEWGGWKEKSECRKLFDRGQDYAERLCREDPQRVEGHYWLARNLCGLAQISRPGRALRLVPVIAKELEIAKKLNQSYNQAGPLRILGRLYQEAPPWPISVGDLPAAVRSLRAAVKLAPENSTNHLFLAEALIASGQAGQACPELEKALQSTGRANWAPGLKEDHQKALQLLSVRCKGRVNLYSFKD